MNLFEVKLVRSICSCPEVFRVCGSLYLFSDLTQPIVLKTPADPWRFLLKRKEDLSSQPLLLVII